MIVELAGAPGVGKTTLAAAVCRALGERGVAALSRQEAAARFGGATVAAAALSFARRQPALVRHVLASQLRSRGRWRDRRQALRRFFRDGAHHELMAGRAAGLVIVASEGLVQRAVGLYVVPGWPAALADATRYATLLPPVDLVLLLRAPVETCVARVVHRGLPRRLRRNPVEGLAAFVVEAARTIEVAAAIVEGRGGRVVVVDAGGPPETMLGGLPGLWAEAAVSSPAAAGGWP